uniref:Uncharacterized protein n=1 Tax=Kalanchoe fedtschenkoi TaxID=63787 RepID=A0A7N0U0W3_KALFE
MMKLRHHSHLRKELFLPLNARPLQPLLTATLDPSATVCAASFAIFKEAIPFVKILRNCFQFVFGIHSPRWRWN